MTSEKNTIPASLATAKPGGCVQLGDGLPPLPEAWYRPNSPNAPIGQILFSEDQMREYARAALSAQPSPGGQVTGVCISDSDRAVLQRLQDALPFAGINGWGKGVEVLERLLRDSLAARQPVRIYGCCAQPEGELHTAECPNLRHLAARQPVGRSFQAGVAEWMGQCFLPLLYSNMTERGDRLLEEVLELLQAHGYDKTRVATLVDYVFGRPVGEPAQEVGGVMVTLAGYCWVAGLDMHANGQAELDRINQPDVMAKIRAKQEAKNALHFDTPLPGDPAATEDWPREGDLVRYGDGSSALAIRLGPHAGGWHGYQCCGGYSFFTKAYRPSRADMDTWLDCAKYRDERTKVADNRVAHEMYLLDNQAVGNG